MNTVAMATAGLLHDIGKLYQRASWQRPQSDLPNATHTAYTGWFIDRHAALFRNAGIDPDWLATTAKRHHGWRQRPEYNPSTVEEWIVYFADNYASRERREGASEGNPATVPLLPIFSAVRLEERPDPPQLGYDLAPLTEEQLFPTLAKHANVRPESYQGQLVDRLEQRLAALAKTAPEQTALLPQLAALLQEVTWCVPSDTMGEPGVSLYDHLRLTAAIAACLWQYHHATDSLREADVKREGDAKFLLAIGDMGGIQEHIFRIRRAQAGTGALAKRLRARSLEVSLASEAMARQVLQALGLPALQRIMSAGGKFYLLLPNTAASLSVLEAARADWEAYALAQGATLLPQLAWQSFPASDFMNFQTVLARAHAQLAEVKRRPFATQLATPYLFADHATTTPRPCAAYDLTPAQRDEPGAVSWQAERDRRVGGRLPRSEGIVFGPPARAGNDGYRFPQTGVTLAPNGSASNNDPSAGYLLRNRLDFTPQREPWEVRPLLGHLPTVRDALSDPRFGGSAERFRSWREEAGLADDEDDPPDHPDRALTFGELAALSEGAKALGALLLDADRMGEVFTRGFDHLAKTDDGYTSPGRIAALSRLLETFFAAEVASLIRTPARHRERLDFDHRAAWKERRYPLIYTVFSGGDDLFLLGPWDVLLEFTLDLGKLYRAFTGDHPDFTLSGGLTLCRASLPVPKIADRARRAEKKAKDAGRNRLTLFDLPVPWSDLDAVERFARALTRRLERDADPFLPRSVAYRLLDLHRLWQRWDQDEDPRGLRYKPLLHYIFRRKEMEPHRELLEPLFDHQSTEIRYLPAALQWALYRTRGE